MVYKALLWTDVFWIWYIKWCKFDNNNLSIVLGSKKGERWNSWTPNTRTERQFNCWLSLSHSIFIFTLPRCQVISQWKQTEEKLGNTLSVWRNFRVDLTWEMGNICQIWEIKISHEKLKIKDIAWIFFTKLGHA